MWNVEENWNSDNNCLFNTDSSLILQLLRLECWVFRLKMNSSAGWGWPPPPEPCLRVFYHQILPDCCRLFWFNKVDELSSILSTEWHNRFGPCPLSGSRADTWGRARPQTFVLLHTYFLSWHTLWIYYMDPFWTHLGIFGVIWQALSFKVSKCDHPPQRTINHLPECDL